MQNKEELYAKADILIEALPYIQKLSGKRVVIKFGGNAMLSESLTEKVLQDVTLLKYVGVNPILVHGGGPDISNMLKKLNIESSFVNGLRVTNKESIEVVQMVLAGKINKEIVSKLNNLGAKGVGLCGLDSKMIQVKKAEPVNGVDLGYVGEIVHIEKRLLELLSDDEYIPVIAPIGVDENGQSYNINADTVAGEIAATLQAEKLIFLTDVDGIRMNEADEDSLISAISVDKIYELIDSGIIEGGMIPKVHGCIKGIESGVNRTHILNGTIPHPIILEIFTDKGIGTMVYK